MNKKPAGVILLGVFAIIQSLPWAITMIWSQIMIGTIRSLTHNFISLTGSSIGLFIFFGGLAGYFMTTGIGMFLYKNWARIMYLITAWIAVIVQGLSTLTFLIITIASAQPALLIPFFISALFSWLYIYIVIYLNKPEIVEVFLMNYQKSDSYSLPSDFGEPIQEEKNNFNEFDSVQNQQMVLEPTKESIDTWGTQSNRDNQKTELIDGHSSIIAMLIEDLGNGRFRSHNITKEKTTIGRTPNNDIHIKNNDTVGRQHAQIVFRQGKFWLHDLASTNGSFINGKKTDKHDLIEGDEIRLGTKTLIFKSL